MNFAPKVLATSHYLYSTLRPTDTVAGFWCHCHPTDPKTSEEVPCVKTATPSQFSIPFGFVYLPLSLPGFVVPLRLHSFCFRLYLIVLYLVSGSLVFFWLRLPSFKLDCLRLGSTVFAWARLPLFRLNCLHLCCIRTVLLAFLWLRLLSFGLDWPRLGSNAFVWFWLSSYGDR